MALNCNKVAMENLRQMNFKNAQELLKQSEQILLSAQSDQINENEKVKLLALTYNNMGCLFKK
jgi:hypothetical protein